MFCALRQELVWVEGPSEWVMEDDTVGHCGNGEMAEGGNEWGQRVRTESRA